MIYCTDDQKKKLEVELEDHTTSFVVNNCNRFGNPLKPEYLAALDSFMKNSMQSFPILIITEPHLMRGFNYRSELGITLFLCRGFKNIRDVT